jgi:hypothetical protein
MVSASSLRARVAIGTLAAAALAASAFPVLASDDEHSKVLGSVHISAGEHTGDATTVNGSVDIGDNAVVKHAETVNGSVTLHDHASAESVKTVNGAVRLEDGVRVAGEVETVNGRVYLAKGVDVSGHVSNVNGSIDVEGARVGGGLETTSGDINIEANSRVERGILVNKSEESWFSFGTRQLPKVVIGPGAVVNGRLRFEREVQLYVSDRATIGQVEGATVNRFSGDRP